MQAAGVSIGNARVSGVIETGRARRADDQIRAYHGDVVVVEVIGQLLESGCAEIEVMLAWNQGVVVRSYEEVAHVVEIYTGGFYRIQAEVSIPADPLQVVGRRIEPDGVDAAVRHPLRVWCAMA